MNKKEIIDWIESSIEFMQDRLDDAIADGYHDAQLRCEGYIQALIHCQAFIAKESEN